MLLKKGVFIHDLKSNAIFAGAEMFCPLKLSDVPHFTDAGGHVSPKKNPEGKLIERPKKVASTNVKVGRHFL